MSARTALVWLTCACIFLSPHGMARSFAAGGDGAHPSLLDRLRRLFGGGDDDPCVFGAGLSLRQVEPGARDVVVPVRKREWERSVGGEEPAKLLVKGLLRGWPATPLAERRTLPADTQAFLSRLAADTWRGLDAFTNRDNGLPVDNVRFAPGSVDVADTRIGDYTNVTNIGLLLIAVTAAERLGLLTRPQAIEHIETVLATVDGLEKHAGFLFNYYDVTSLERTSNLISFVDSSWLTAGLIVARTSFPELAEPCSKLIEQQDYRFFYDSVLEQMSHGYYVHLDARSRYHYGVLFTESRLGSVIAVGKGDVPESHWFHMARTFPAACDWQTMAPRGRREKEIDGTVFRGGWYEWEEFRYVPSWGGSLFEALMPTLVLDEGRWAPASLGENARRHVAVQERFALRDLGYPVWGLSPCSTTDADGYFEFGVKALGLAGYGPGPVTPHASALALGVDPDAAAANLAKLAELYDVYGDFGFYDAVDARSGRVAYTYLTLDQAMTFIAVANHLTGGAIQNAFASDPIVQKALPVLAKESFFD
jgi:hypothetical protein